MMNGIGPEEAGRMTFWQYSAMRHIWNERHRLDGGADDDIEIPDADFVRDRHRELSTGAVSGKVH